MFTHCTALGRKVKIEDWLSCADVVRDMIIGPGSEPPGANPMPFGWWTWFNRAELPT